MMRVLRARTACALRFSRPLGALLRPVPAGPISCQIRSWGCALQSLVPPAWPYAVSGAAPLMTFKRTPRHHCSSARPRRSEDRAALRRPTHGSSTETEHRASHATSLKPPRRPCRSTHRAKTTAGASLSRRRRNGFASATFLTTPARPAPKCRPAACITGEPQRRPPRRNAATSPPPATTGLQRGAEAPLLSPRRPRPAVRTGAEAPSLPRAAARPSRRRRSTHPRSELQDVPRFERGLDRSPTSPSARSALAMPGSPRTRTSEEPGGKRRPRPRFTTEAVGRDHGRNSGVQGALSPSGVFSPRGSALLSPED
jgi:hypothetical protein